MSELDADVLKALAAMAGQYLTVGDELDSQSMAAGQNALRILAAEGLVDYDGCRCGSWTEAGRNLLARI